MESYQKVAARYLQALARVKLSPDIVRKLDGALVREGYDGSYVFPGGVREVFRTLPKVFLPYALAPGQVKMPPRMIEAMPQGDFTVPLVRVEEEGGALPLDRYLTIQWATGDDGGVTAVAYLT